jgi:hypothetical protein
VSNTATEIAAFFHLLIVDVGIAEIAGDDGEENHISFADGFSESVVLPDFDEIEAGLRSGVHAQTSASSAAESPLSWSYPVSNI